MASALAQKLSCDDHTPSPSGFLQAYDWAQRMMKTHRQVRCPECGLFAIWLPKKAKP